MKFLLYTVIFITFLLVYNESNVKAIEANIEKMHPDIHILVIFSSDDGNIDENQRVLDMALGHFSGNISFVNSENFEETDLNEVTHLVYYGETEENLSNDIPDAVSSFDGPTMAIGHNVEQLGDSFTFVETGESTEQTIDELAYMDDEDKTREIEPEYIIETKLDKDVEVLVQGSGNQGVFPLIVHHDDRYYVATDTLLSPFSVYFSQVLNTMFDAETNKETPAYIRLEDVHPLVDPESLMAIAEELKERDIPYMIAVIPVYTDPETGKEYRFEDMPEVLKVLKYMQENGGSVVLHGYTHQFRQSETGEGFEFWDVENEMPIYHGPDEEVVNLSEDDFERREAYETYMEENRHFERAYIEDRLTKGVQELANYGIFPLSFEAPHYTMSQNGYAVTSEFFSTYVGQAQLSDEEWEIMNTTPYASKPDFLNGMLLLPETIGFVQPELDDPVANMMESAELYQVTDGGVIGSFYHPYLGEEGFIELMDEMEKIANIEWIDLKEMDNTVKVDNVTIVSRNGEIDVNMDHLGLMTTSFDYTAYHIKEFLRNVAWVIAWIGALTVIVLICFTAFQKTKEKQTDSAERRVSNG